MRLGQTIAAAAAGMTLLFGASAVGGKTQDVRLENGYFRLKIDGAGIVGMKVDPKGKGGGNVDFAKRLRPEFWRETPDRSSLWRFTAFPGGDFTAGGRRLSRR